MLTFPEFEATLKAKLLTGESYMDFQKGMVEDAEKTLEELDYQPIPVKAQEATIEKVVNVPLGEGEEFALKFTISSAKRDRDRDTIALDGWELGGFEKNPVVLFGHDHRQPPVARSPGIIANSRRLMAIARFPQKEVSEFGNMIGRLAMHKFLNMASVGFMPKRFEINEEERGIDFIEQELWEWSVVPIGSNPDALQDAKSQGIDLSAMKGWAEQVLDELNKTPGDSVREVARGDTGIVTLHDPSLERKDVEHIYSIVAPESVQVPDTKGIFDDEDLEIDDKEPGSATPDPKANALPEDAEWKTSTEEEWAALIEAGHEKMERQFSHHAPDGALNWKGVRAAMEDALIQTCDKDVYAHLAAHYAEFNKEAPAFAWVEMGVLGYAPELYKMDDEGMLAHRDMRDLEFFEAIDAMEILAGGTESFTVPELDRKGFYDGLTLRYAKERVLTPEYRHIEGQSLKHFGDRFMISANGEITDKTGFVPLANEEFELLLEDKDVPDDDDAIEVDPKAVEAAVRAMAGRLP